MRSERLVALISLFVLAAVIAGMVIGLFRYG
jgi:hypothetical protein